MTSKHPLYNAVVLWASDPEEWRWAYPDFHRIEECAENRPPAENSLRRRILVHRDWLRDPESVTVYVRLQDGAEFMREWYKEPKPTWDHETYEYRVEPRKRTGRMVEAPERGTQYYLSNPHRADWYEPLHWAGDEFDRMWLERGLCHYDADSAIAAAKGMVECIIER